MRSYTLRPATEWTDDFAHAPRDMAGAAAGPDGAGAVWCKIDLLGADGAPLAEAGAVAYYPQTGRCAVYTGGASDWADARSVEDALAQAQQLIAPN